MSDKNSLRKVSKEKLNLLSDNEFQLLNGKVLINLEEYLQSEMIKDFKPENILLWLPAFKKEIDLYPFIDRNFSKFSFFSPVMSSDKSLTFYRLESDYRTTTIISKAGIPEPQNKFKFDTKTLSPTLILLPGLAFSKSGKRLGRGFGCYDRFLNGLSGDNFLKISLCFEMQIQDDIPMDSYDQEFDVLISDRQMIHCKENL